MSLIKLFNFFENNKVSIENSFLNNKEIIETQLEDKNMSINYLISLATDCEHLAFHSKKDERKYYLEKAIHLCNEVLKKDPLHYQAIIKILYKIVENKNVRDLDRAKSLFQTLKENNQFPSYLKSLERKAHRLSGEAKEIKSNFYPTNTGELSEVRKDYRSLIRKYKKEKNNEALKKVLNNYYKLGIFFSACYGRFDCSVGVGNAYQIAEIMKKHLTKDIDSYSYLTHGKINNCNYLSNLDWKVFEKVFGKINKSFDSMFFYKNLFTQSFEKALIKMKKDRLKMRKQAGFSDPYDDCFFHEGDKERLEFCSINVRQGLWNKKPRKELRKKLAKAS